MLEFPGGLIVNPLRYSAVNHATSSLFHNAAASVGRPVAALFPWRTYRRTIEYDIRRRNQVNANPTVQNAGVQIDSLVAWTINDTDEMACLTQMGVSGIITDKIELPRCRRSRQRALKCDQKVTDTDLSSSSVIKQRSGMQNSSMALSQCLRWWSPARLQRSQIV